MLQLFAINIQRFVVIFSIERLLAVYFPLKSIAFCNTTHNKSSVYMAVFSGLCLYSFNMLATGLKEFDLKSKCVPMDTWLVFARYMTLFDIFITMLVPFLLISIINALIAVRLTKFSCGMLCTLWVKTKESRSKRSYHRSSSLAIDPTANNKLISNSGSQMTSNARKVKIF